MHIYILFAHPARKSFSRNVLYAFTRGLEEAGHSYEVGDLYAMGFRSEMDEEQYMRETSGNPDLPVPPDVEAEQAKIERADGLAFIYPVWWSDCPAKLKGWFDRVLTCGYAFFYNDNGDRGTRIEIRKALILCPAGHSVEHLEETGIADSMRRITLNDRLLGVGIREARMEILGGMIPYDEAVARRNLERAHELGRIF